MSLINDALKRAREAQDTRPAEAAPPQFRPVDNSQAPRLSPIYLIVGMGMLVIVLGLLLVWQLAQRREVSQRLETRAHDSGAAAIAEPGPAASPIAAAPAPVPPVTTAPNPAPAPVVAPTAATAPAPAASIKEPEPTPAAPPAAVVVAAPEVAKAPVLKLQGITFHPTRPAAMISGKTLFIGDKTLDWRLIAITPDTATLVNGTQTNILTLAE